MRLTAKLERRRNGVCINCQQVVMSLNITLLPICHHQVQEPKPPQPLTFQLLPALEDGFFSDLTIRSEDGFKVSCYHINLRSILDPLWLP